MEKNLFENMNLMARINALEDNCDKKINHAYTRTFKPHQIVEFKDVLASSLITVAAFEEDLAKIKAEYKKKIEPFMEQYKDMLQKIKTKSEYISETCYKFINYDEKMVGIYNAEGELIEERPMMPDENQKTIPINRTGTND